MSDPDSSLAKSLFGSAHSTAKRGIFRVSSYAHATESVIAPFFTGWECVSPSSTPYDFDNRTRQDNRGTPFIFLQYTIRGTAYFVHRETTTPVPAGHAVLISVPSATRLHADTRSAYEFLWVNMLGSAATAWADNLTAKHGHVFSLPRHAPSLTCLARLHAMVSSGAWDRSPDLAMMENFRLTVLLPRDMQRTVKDLPLLDQARARIQEHCGDPEFGVSRLARDLQISRGHLARLFTAATGRSPLQVIKEQRMQQAAILLSQGVPIHKVSAACGYRDVNYFRRDYRRQTGSSPVS